MKLTVFQILVQQLLYCIFYEMLCQHSRTGREEDRGALLKHLPYQRLLERTNKVLDKGLSYETRKVQTQT